MRVSLWMIPFFYVAYAWQTCVPKRCVVLGKTRISYTWSKLADALIGEDKGEPQSGMGMVVDYAYDYTSGPNPYIFGSNQPAGKYLDNTRFPRGYIVQPDDGLALRFVPEGSMTCDSGYAWRIPILHSRSSMNRRVGDLPVPLITQSDGSVRFCSDSEDVKRSVRRIFFTSLGTPEYEVLMTDAEDRKEREHRIRKGGQAALLPDKNIHENLTHGYYRSEELIAL